MLFRSVVLGLNAEWSVLLEYMPHGGVVKSKVVKDAAVIQITWRKKVYTLMVSSELVYLGRYSTEQPGILLQMRTIRKSSKRNPPLLL